MQTIIDAYKSNIKKNNCTKKEISIICHKVAGKIINTSIQCAQDATELVNKREVSDFTKLFNKYALPGICALRAGVSAVTDNYVVDRDIRAQKAQENSKVDSRELTPEEKANLIPNPA